MVNHERDADEGFVTGSISRAQIATDLNKHLEDYKRRPEVTKTDPRLTTEICVAYAAAIGAIDQMLHRVAIEEQRALATARALISMGVLGTLHEPARTHIVKVTMTVAVRHNDGYQITGEQAYDAAGQAAEIALRAADKESSESPFDRYRFEIRDVSVTI